MNRNAKSRFLAAALALSLGASLGGCSSQGASSYAQAEAAFERHHYRTARIHLANLIAEGAADAETHLLYARLMLEMGDGISAQSAILRVPDKELDGAARSEMMAHAYILQGDPDQAAALMEQIDTGSLSQQGVRMLVWAHWDLDTLEDNADILAAGLKKYPKSAHLHAFAGDLAIAQGNWSLASEHAAQAMAADPKNFEGLLLNGRVAIFNSDLKAARAHYAAASQAYPDHALPIANMAGLDLDMGNAKSAAKVLKAGMGKHPHFPFMLFQKARLDYKNGDFAEARLALEEAKPSYQNYAPLGLLSAKVEEKLGNRATALRELDRVNAIDPGNAEARALAAKLSGA